MLIEEVSFKAVRREDFARGIQLFSKDFAKQFYREIFLQYLFPFSSSALMIDSYFRFIIVSLLFTYVMRFMCNTFPFAYVHTLQIITHTINLCGVNFHLLALLYSRDISVYILLRLCKCMVWYGMVWYRMVYIYTCIYMYVNI